MRAIQSAQLALFVVEAEDFSQPLDLAENDTFRLFGGGLAHCGQPNVERGADDVVVMEVEFLIGILSGSGVLIGRQNEPSGAETRHQYERKTSGAHGESLESQRNRPKSALAGERRHDSHFRWHDEY
jgi:hypothetical protein